MLEFGFELALAAHLERTRDAIVSRQLGTHVHGRRVMDIVCLTPGPEFDARAAITPATIPPLAIESTVGTGKARYWKDAFDCHPERAADVIEAAVDCGFFERERRNGRTYLRQTVRYPDWFNHIVGIENKPDLGRPGELETQLLTDVKLGLVDELVLATESHVTGAHRNRIPDAVGIWQFDPETRTVDILREPDPLQTPEAGVEILNRHSARAEIRIAEGEAIERARRRVAERAYGKGWRTFDWPACDRVESTDGVPYCPWKGRNIRPATDCGTDCDGHRPASPPQRDRDTLRGANSPWEPDPGGVVHRQAGLDRYAGE